MKKLHFKDIAEFCVFLIEKRDYVISKNEYGSVCAVGSFEQVRDITEYLIGEGFPIWSIELENPEFSERDYDYLLEFDEDGLSIEKAWRDSVEDYVFTDGEGVYIIYPSDYPLEKANSGICGEDDLGLHYVEIGDCCNCESCDCCDDKDNDKSEDNSVLNKSIKISRNDDNTIHIEINGSDKEDADKTYQNVSAAVDTFEYLLDLFRSFDSKNSMFRF